MADDLEDDELELDEQGNPKKPQSIGTPIFPAAGGGQPNSRFQDVRPIIPQQSSTPAITPIAPDAPGMQAPSGAGSIGTPISSTGPAAPRPAAARAQNLAANPPEYHGWNKFLDTLGRVTGPGRAIESLGGYGTLGYDTKLGRANEQAQAEERQIEGGEKERQANATLEETQARTGKEQQATEASKAGMQDVMITLPDGRQVHIPQSQLGPDIRAMITEQGANQRNTETNRTKGDIATQGNITKEDIAAGKTQPHITTMQNGKAHIMERDPKTGAYTIDRGEAPPSYGTTAPLTRTVELLGPDNVMHRYQFNMDTKSYSDDLGPAPTGTAAHQIFQAGAIEDLAPKVIDDINAHREVLGKLSSYYKQWLAGTPISDPVASQMMAELMSLAAMQPALHAFRSTNALEAFEHLIGGLAKDPDATIATIQGLMKTPQAFTDIAHGGGGGHTNAPARPKGVPQEAVWNAKDKQWQMPNKQ